MIHDGNLNGFLRYTILKRAKKTNNKLAVVNMRTSYILRTVVANAARINSFVRISAARIVVTATNIAV